MSDIECSGCGADLADVPIESPCPTCGASVRLYGGDTAFRFLIGLRAGSFRADLSLQPGFSHLWEQLHRRLERIQKLIAAAHQTPPEDLLDEVDAFLVTCFHIRDWIFEDKTIQPPISRAIVDNYIDNSKYLKNCRAYANTYKHLVRARRDVSYARALTFERPAGQNPSVMIAYWDGNDPAQTTVQEIGALDLAKNCILEWEQFIAAHGGP